MANQAHFGPALFSLMRSLAKNNSREWLLAHEEKCEEIDPAGGPRCYLWTITLEEV
jgi:hypothetical protein